MKKKAKASIAIGVAVLVLLAAGWLLVARDYADGGGPPGDMQRPPPVVEVAIARRDEIRVTVQAVGTIEAAERIDITSQVTGKITEIRFSEGQRVEAGQVLVALDAGRQQASLDVARAEMRDAVRQLRRVRGLKPGVEVSPSEVDEAEARVATARARVAEAEAALQERRITAPFTGVVGLREVSPGALIEPGTTITTLATADNLKVQFELPLELLTQLKPGLPIEVDIAGFDRRITGRVAHIDNVIDPATRSVAVEGALEALSDWLKPGLFATVETVVETRPGAVLIPEEALIIEGGNSYVYVVGGGLQVERRPVKVGVRRPGEAEIIEGLESGTRVVIRGLQTVQAGQRVQLAGDERGRPSPAAAR